MKILFIAPHADDVEVMSAQICLAAVRAGFEVHESLSCADEYGTTRVDFRGRRLARIRKYEMNNAAKVYGVNQDGSPKIQLHWQPYIDGHVPFNREAVNRFKNLIVEIRPDILIGPDPFFPMGPHPDHIATGRNFFFALKEMKPEERPKWMFFNQSFFPDFSFPYLSEKIEYEARMKHKSQFHPLLMKIFAKSSHLWKRSVFTGGKRADRLRIIRFDPNSNFIADNKWNISRRLKQALWYYGLRVGFQPPEYFKEPSVDQILKDYKENGWV